MWRHDHGVCLSGLTDYHLNDKGVPFYINKKENWGPCGACVQADKIIEMIENKEQKLLYQTV